jgi:uncharacterized integral membrane protein
VSKLRLILGASALALMIILAFQNLQPVTLQLLFWPLEVPPPLLIALVYLLGAVTPRPLWKLIRRSGGGKTTEASSE